MSKINIEEIKTFIDQQPEGTKVYIGADSERINIKGVFYADYATCVVIHKGGKHGCKVFGEIVRERDYDQKSNRPSMRLMNEVIKISELFQRLQEALIDKDVEVHLDLNGSDMYASNHIVHQAIGYIKGTCNTTPKIKPAAWAASCCADRLKELLAA